MKKRIIGLMLAIVTVLTLSAPFAVSANSEPPTTELGDIVSTNVEYFPEYGFTITEEMDVDNRIMLTLEREELSARELRNLDIEQVAYDTLTMLGFNQETIDSLNAKQFEAFATSTYIVTNVTYTRQDNLGNEIILTPEEAYDIAEWENSGENKIDIFPPSPLQSMQQSGFMALSGGAVDVAWVHGIRMQVGNGVLNLRHTAARHINDRERYSFITEINWLSMPQRRNIDSIGSIATDMRVAGTPVARYSFDQTRWTSVAIGPITQRIQRTAPVTFQNHGQFMGHAATINIPHDWNNNWILDYASHNRLNASIVWDGRISTPNQVVNFNSIGSYHHDNRIHAFGSTSISISLSIPNSPLSVSIGIPISGGNILVLGATLLVRHDPNWRPPTHPGW